MGMVFLFIFYKKREEDKVYVFIHNKDLILIKANVNQVQV